MLVRTDRDRFTMSVRGLSSSAMGRVLNHIDGATADWIMEQHMFFVATAPAVDGHVNVSPKGLDSLRVLGPNEVVYLDLTGSGAETIAHIRQNGRITIMMNAFDGPPRILRIYGEGAIHFPDGPRFDELTEHFPKRRGTRAFITVTVTRVSDSCGYAVPKMQHVGDREHLDRYVANRTDEEIADSWVEQNATSIDGLPAIDV